VASKIAAAFESNGAHVNDIEQTLQQTLYEEIPITQQLRVAVQSYDGVCLKLHAPLAENINHKGTIFAGSINAVMTLAGWGSVWLLLKEAGITANVIIQDSAINYLLPVTQDFTAICHKPAEDTIAHFMTMLKRRGKARIELIVHIDEGEQRVATFHGRYVAYVSGTNDTLSL
jgi:thioesterase domain-containing protein